jgi:uncharacterized membrane protein
MSNKLAWAAAALATAGLIGVAAPADAAPPKPKKYANCAALNKVYQHGVAKKGAKDKVRGTTRPVTTFLVYTAAYNLNKAKLDRDKDGIACEKR